jgi:hypothetical protein
LKPKISPSKCHKNHSAPELSAAITVPLDERAIARLRSNRGGCPFA